MKNKNIKFNIMCFTLGDITIGLCDNFITIVSDNKTMPLTGGTKFVYVLKI